MAIVDHSVMKLGCKPPKFIVGLSLLSAYTTNMPASPDKADWSLQVSNWGMMLNDVQSCCTCSACGHAEQVWTANIGKQFTPPDRDIEAAYEGSCGFNPTDPSTDGGGVASDVLTWWVENGISGRKPLAFVGVSPKNHQSVKDSIYILGVCYAGADLPISCQTQDVWDIPAEGLDGDGLPGSWGGHAFIVVAYDTRGLTIVTWGMLKKITWAFWDAYVSEAYAILSKDWSDATGKGPNALPFATIQDDYKALGGKLAADAAVSGG